MFHSNKIITTVVEENDFYLNCTFVGVSFERCQSTFVNCVFRGVILEELVFNSSAFRDCIFINCNLSKIRALKTSFTDCVFERLTVKSVELFACDFKDCDFDSCVLDNVHAISGGITESYITACKAKLVLTDFYPEDITIFNCDFRGSSLMNCSILDFAFHSLILDNTYIIDSLINYGFSRGTCFDGVYFVDSILGDKIIGLSFEVREDIVQKVCDQFVNKPGSVLDLQYWVNNFLEGEEGSVLKVLGYEAHLAAKGNDVLDWAYNHGI